MKSTEAVGAALVVVGMLWAVPAQPLDPARKVHQYALDRWQIEDGLPQSSVLDVVQSGDGFLWLATYEGVVRFDGRRFDTLADPHAQVITNALREDTDGVLWAGTQSGLLRLRPGEPDLMTTADGLVDDFVQTLAAARTGGLWIGTQHGLSRLRDGTFTHFTEADGLPHGDVRAIVESRTGDLWVGTQEGLGLLRGGVFTTFTTADGLAGDSIQALLETAGGPLLVGTDGGLAERRGDRFIPVARPDGSDLGEVTALHEDRDKNLWIGTRDAGLLRFRDGRFGALTHAQGLGDDFVKAIAEDHEGSLWVGTWTGGLHRLKDGKVLPYTTLDGLPDETVLPILEDRAGDLWAGTPRGLSRLRDGVFTTFTTTDGLADDFVWSLLEGRGGELFIGTANGLSRYRDGVFESLDSVTGLASAEIHALLEDRRGALWIGTWGDGLHRLEDGELDRFTVDDGLAQDFVMALHEDRDGGLWIGTTDGLSRFADGVFSRYTTADGLAHNAVVSFHQDEDGDLWIGTDGGLSRLRDGVFTTFTTADGLFNNRFFQILEDDLGNLWGSCNRGIFHFPRSELLEVAAGRRTAVRSVVYTTSEGMKSRETNGAFQPAGWKDRQGALWFPTIGGLVKIEPLRQEVNDQPPPVLIDRLVLASGEIPLASASPRRLELDRGNFEIHYTGLSFRDPEKVSFRYRLEGDDPDWIDAGPRRVAYYTNVGPGSYRFRVIAANEDGVWNEDGTTLEIYVRPAFYQTWTFYVLGGAGAALLGWGLVRLRLRRLLSHNRELRRMKNELETKNAEIAGQNAELERFAYTVSHDLKTPVVTIKGFVGLLERDLEAGDDTSVRRDLRHITDAATKMHQLLDELIELGRVGRVISPPVEVSLDEVVKEAITLVSGPISDHGVRVRVAPGLGVVSADRTRLREVFQNLIENAVKYMGSADLPTIAIGASRRDGEVLCHVRDNGQGIKAAYLDRIFDLFEKLDPKTEGTGIGLALVKRIVEFHGGRIWAESGGAEKGATFFFTLPLPRDVAIDDADEVR